VVDALCGRNAEVAEWWTHCVGGTLKLGSVKVGGITLCIAIAFCTVMKTENRKCISEE
jgi:hypothetical protein